MEIIYHLRQVSDTRSHINQDYPVLEMSFLLISALISGSKSWADIHIFGETRLGWLRQYLPFEQGIPTQQNIARIVRTMVPESLMAALVSWVNAIREDGQFNHIAIDGKDVRGVAKYSGSTSLSMVSAFDVEQGLVLYHKAGRGKGNELSMARELIKCLKITDTIVTLDALHCQVETIEQIKEQKGIALIQCKKNQPRLHAAVDELFQAYWTLPEQGQACLSESETGHGRKETRTVWSTEFKIEGELKEKWSALKSAVAVVRERSVKGKTSHETHYYVCTEHLSMSELMTATRRHWHTENSQHHILDVTFKEDDQRMHAGNSAVNIACFRRLALNLLKQHNEGKKKTTPQKIGWCAGNDKYRHDVLFGNN
jgi:predicted transposase YbfD/YdcC